jgi:ribosomal-protein-alanine N-acetyltransferase
MRLRFPGGELMVEEPVINPDDIFINTERLILRPISESDAPDIYNNVKEYDIAKWTINIPHPYPKDGAIKFIKQTKELMKKGLSYELAIQIKSTKEVVGVISLMKVDRRHKNAEIGYWVVKKFWNRGIATEAASKVMEFGFQVLNLERIYAKCFHNNEVSRKVMEKVGMKLEGKFRHEVFKENKFIDTLYYGILKEDWKEPR